MNNDTSTCWKNSNLTCAKSNRASCGETRYHSWRPPR